MWPDNIIPMTTLENSLSCMLQDQNSVANTYTKKSKCFVCLFVCFTWNEWIIKIYKDSWWLRLNLLIKLKHCM